MIRAGFGISYFPDPFSASDELGQNPPFTISQTFSSPATFPLPSAFAPANQCTASNQSASCQPILSNPFPQGAVALPLSSLTTTTALNAAHPALIGHSRQNQTPNMQTYTLGSGAPESWRRCGTGLCRQSQRPSDLCSTARTRWD